VPFVKLDCGILDSSIWIDRPAREVFLTALLMAEPYVLDEPEPQIEVCSLRETGFVVPPGVYGFVHAAGVGIVRRAGIEDQQKGLEALERLGKPEEDSRSSAWEGRRLVRVNGGFIVLNFDTYRQRDETGAERARRYRAKKKQLDRQRSVTRDNRDVTRDNRDDVTQAEAEAEAEAEAVSSEGISHQEDSAVVKECPAPSTPNIPVVVGTKLPAVRDQQWLQNFINALDANAWRENRASKEARVAFNFHRWRNNIKNRTIFSPDREKRCAKLIAEYGLIRVLFAIEGQLTHPDFNQADKGVSYRGWDNLFRVQKGYENIEKCSNWAIRKEHGAKVAATIKQLIDKRGWSPSEIDEELFNTIVGVGHE